MLMYPFETAPALSTGATIEVAPGVLWLRMAVPGPLEFVNVYALAEAHGWSVIDTGMRLEPTAQAWRVAFADALGERPIERVIATHMHPDHAGMAGWILRKFPGSTLWMSRLEYLSGRVLTTDLTREAPDDAIRFYRAAGWDADALDNYKARFGQFSKMFYPWPDSYRRLADGDRLRVGHDEWRVIGGAGHCLEHVCLWQPERRLFVSGDQVLPKITSNVSVFPMEPHANPMHDWLTSLVRIKGIVPDDVLVLPGHNMPFRGLHARIDDLVAGHETAFANLQRLLLEPKRVVDTFEILYKRPIGKGLLQLATGEALAHLNYLVAQGRIDREEDAEGVVWWRARAP